jgi:MFS family permease
MNKISAAIIVFIGGFAIMVLEIIGARFLARFFGSSFYVWISQIGVILIALSIGYYIGGWLADYFKRASFAGLLLIPAGIYSFLVPSFAPSVMDAIVLRHPAERDIPMIWQKLDPAIGSAIFFLLPCFVLAILSPYVIRMTSRHLSHVGRISGLVYAFSTVGSIAGVFASGYILIDHMGISDIIRATGVLTVALGIFCLIADVCFRTQIQDNR